ncbi:TNT domain-containing protein [Kitasatospora sp. RB6PN24]|uniref:TNT domain-containing protein n=1 Tax=Kitasatospora humi TaxID=2893891 RepID=UPI001E451D65|nr:TNT domain-containing protein [Kitasatospora humi]MCC9309063.1 TNT domain-containing protein [Kitasatospora humi]
MNITQLKAGSLLAAAMAGAALFTVAAPAAHADTLPSDQCSTDFQAGDPRLGPARLPATGPVGREVLGYDRTGGASDQAFLQQYYDSASGGWKYPPADGYVVLNGRPVEFDQTLLTGQDIDRFGSEYGAYLAPAGLPYAMRSLPPQSLDGTPAAGCNYHDYKVLKPFAVHGGPIAPWFNQPGYGWQYQLDGALLPGAPAKVNVGWLVANGYLQRLV